MGGGSTTLLKGVNSTDAAGKSNHCQTREHSTPPVMMMRPAKRRRVRCTSIYNGGDRFVGEGVAVADRRIPT
jgi:hypothetical protein